MLGIAGDGIVHEHRPELENLESLTLETQALLHEEIGPREVNLIRAAVTTMIGAVRRSAREENTTSKTRLPSGILLGPCQRGGSSRYLFGAVTTGCSSR